LSLLGHRLLFHAVLWVWWTLRFACRTLSSFIGRITCREAHHTLVTWVGGRACPSLTVFPGMPCLLPSCVRSGLDWDVAAPFVPYYAPADVRRRASCHAEVLLVSSLSLQLWDCIPSLEENWLDIASPSVLTSGRTWRFLDVTRAARTHGVLPVHLLYVFLPL